jgi:hypothetical protein
MYILHLQFVLLFFAPFLSHATTFTNPLKSPNGSDPFIGVPI